MDTRAKAEAARQAARRILGVSGKARTAALVAVADALDSARDRLLAANDRDLEEADGLEPALRARLQLAPKLDAAIDGVRRLGAMADPVGQTLRATRLDDGLHLYQTTVPLGVVACIFESRPDVCIQIPALALRTGNAVLLKGGKEAGRSNAAIIDVIQDALASLDLPAGLVQCLDGRDEVHELLAMDDLVDLIIPRGSNALVRSIQQGTHIPVLGHAAGVCHIYVDEAADGAKAERIILDAKTDSPSACNAVETILVHAARDDLATRLQGALGEAGVTVHDDAPGTEFGSLDVNLIRVAGMQEALDHIAQHGSGHTDAIVTEDEAAARAFVAGVDAAGVFVNASTRFADGYRYGLGAEVGISTGKIHARGPVGVEGLLSTRWLLAGDGHVAATYRDRPLRHAALPQAWTKEAMLHG